MILTRNTWGNFIEMWKNKKGFTKIKEKEGKITFAHSAQEGYIGHIDSSNCPALLGVSLAPGEGPVKVRVEKRWAIVDKNGNLYLSHHRIRKMAIDIHIRMCFGQEPKRSISDLWKRRQKAGDSAVQVRVVVAEKGEGK